LIITDYNSGDIINKINDADAFFGRHLLMSVSGTSTLLTKVDNGFNIINQSLADNR